MSDLQALHGRATDRFGALVHEVPAEHWHTSTPCTEWDVRQLVNHVTVELLWVPPLLAGATVEEVGDRFDGDRLGADPAAAWDAAAAGARDAWAGPGAWERTVALSFGPTPAEEYAFQLTVDLTVHGVDLARAVGAGERPDDELVAYVHQRFAPQADAWRAAGALGERVPVPEGTGELGRLLALTGRAP
jgi:uncharacterized protein (TIGR03086 family)